MFEDIQDYDLLLVLPASCMARRNHGTSSCLPSGQAVRLPDRLGRFAVRSNRALVARIRCVVRCTRSLPPSSSCGSNRCEHLTTYVSLARYAGPCMPWHIASQPMAACAELPCRSHFVRVIAAITHCVLLLAEKQRRSAIGTPNTLPPLEPIEYPLVPLNLSPSGPARRISCACLRARGCSFGMWNAAATPNKELVELSRKLD